MRRYPMNAWVGAVVTPLAAFRRQLWHRVPPVCSPFPIYKTGRVGVLEASTVTVTVHARGQHEDSDSMFAAHAHFTCTVPSNPVLGQL